MKGLPRILPGGSKTGPRLSGRLCAVYPVVVFALASAPLPVVAEIDGNFARRLSDVSTTLRIEGTLADALARGSKAGVRRLSATIRHQDGRRIEHLADITEAGGEKALGIALRLEPCEIAGLAIRAMVIGIDRGHIRAEFTQGAVVLSPKRIGDIFAENLVRCEMIAKKQASKRRIGSTCVIDGSCEQDGN
ncbi:MAG: hypothetical protein LCH38_04360 [Proteobacteria bacterium]|nr:hypothetical protein [Pseudomonadota bacterium]